MDRHADNDVTGRGITSAAAVLDRLDERGLGRWDLRTDVEVDLTSRPAVRVVLPDGTAVGVLECSTVIDLTEAEVAEVEGVAALIGSVVDAEMRAARARRRAAIAEAESVTDALTGLANARGWWSTLEREAARCERNGQAAVIAVIDLDGFKQINDREGHLAGDIVLRLTAATLRASVRPHDLVARVGGDEFAVLAVDVDGPLPLALVARITAGLDGDAIDASIGAAVHAPGRSIDETFQMADQRMYEAKRARRH